VSPITTDAAAERSERIARDLRLQQRSRSRRELRMFARRLGILLTALVAMIVIGTIAFTVTEGASIAYSFAWTLDTVTTLGAMQDPRDAAGRVVVVLLEVFGIGTLFYALATVAEFFVSGQTISSSAASAGSAAKWPGTWAKRASGTSRSTAIRPTARRPRRWALSTSRATRPTTRCCSRPGSSAPER
jgi:hypothetical protein